MSVQASQPLTANPADEAAIRALYQQMMDGWNKGSGAAFAVPFAEDAVFVASDGSYFKGREEIASLHQMLFDKFLKGSRLVGKARSVRFLTSRLAVMHAIGGTVMSGQSDIEPERNSVQTLVAVKGNARWRLAAFQNSRAHYMGRPALAQELTEELRQLL